jgi:hypothetical protein
MIAEIVSNEMLSLPSVLAVACEFQIVVAGDALDLQHCRNCAGGHSGKSSDLCFIRTKGNSSRSSRLFSSEFLVYIQLNC